LNRQDASIPNNEKQVVHLFRCGVVSSDVTIPLNLLNLKYQRSFPVINFYADDTQIFLSFRPPDFHSNLTRLQDVLQHVC